MIVGVPRETFPGERRVALVPALLPPLGSVGMEVVVEEGAGREAGFSDDSYRQKGAEVVSSREGVFARADVIVQVRTLGANPDRGRKDFELFKSGQMVIGFADPLSSPHEAGELAGKGVTLFAMELIPRITRAQSMDALSSMATVAGYKAVLLASEQLPRMFPMLMTAAGTLAPARVFVVGAGVAGLQAIATARRLGAVVSAYDVRPAVKEQVESLGARFAELPLEAEAAEDKEGYARQMDEDFYRRQRELMARLVAQNDVVITTAAVPGKKAPILVTKEMVESMEAGSVVVDLAAERGGNCELTEPGRTVEYGGVKIVGPVNLASTVPYHASQMYAKNVVNFMTHVFSRKDGAELDLEDEITRETMVTRGGELVHPRIKQLVSSLDHPGEKPAG